MMQVLIVDDERMIRIGICTAIPWDILGFEKVFSAESGKEALALLSQEKIDVMITDIKMAKELTIDKMHRSNQIVKRCTAFAHPLGLYPNPKFIYVLRPLF